MKNNLLILSFVILFVCCKEPKGLDDNQISQTYSLMNDFILDSLYKVDIISREVMVFQNEDNHSDDPPPPPGVYCSYSDEMFTELIKSKIIDSSDLMLFKEQMISGKKFSLNPDSLNIKTFSRDSLIDFISKNRDIDFWGYFRKKYNSRSFLIVSFPLFSKDGNTIVMTIDNHCGGLCGSGVIYVFKKTNGKWSVVFSKLEYVS